MCAKADDPLTINQNYRALRIGVFSADGSSLQGTVIFQFLGYTTSHSASHVSAVTCEGAWEALENVEDVDCQSENSGAGSFTMLHLSNGQLCPWKTTISVIKATLHSQTLLVM